MEFNLMSAMINNNIYSNMVNLPQKILKMLDKRNIGPPYFFKISTQSELVSYVGVRQFTSNENIIEIPLWLYNELGLSGTEIINISILNNIPKGKYIKISPEDKRFFDIPEYRHCLEVTLSKFPLLYQGQYIILNILDNNYRIKILDIDMDWEQFDFNQGIESLELNVIDIINTNLNVDIENIFIKDNIEKKINNNEHEDEIDEIDDIDEIDEDNHLNLNDLREARIKFYNKIL